MLCLEGKYRTTLRIVRGRLLSENQGASEKSTFILFFKTFANNRLGGPVGCSGWL